MPSIESLDAEWWQSLRFEWKESRSCFSNGCVHFFPSNKLLVVDAGGYNFVELWPTTMDDILTVLRMLGVTE